MAKTPEEADNSKLPPDSTVVPTSMLNDIQDQMRAFELKQAELEAKNAGLEALLESNKDANTIGEPKLREKKTFEPKFRTVRLRKFPMKGDYENQGYVVGWTQRGAYQKVDRSGVNPVNVDYLQVFFLGHERDKDGKLQAEEIKLLDLLTHGTQVVCKILKVNREDVKVPTGEEIDVTIFDPAHGLVSTGDKVDGYVGRTDISYVLDVPGVTGPVEIDGLYVN